MKLVPRSANPGKADYYGHRWRERRLLTTVGTRHRAAEYKTPRERFKKYPFAVLSNNITEALAEPGERFLSMLCFEHRNRLPELPIDLMTDLAL